MTPEDTRRLQEMRAKRSQLEETHRKQVLTAIADTIDNWQLNILTEKDAIDEIRLYIRDVTP